MEAYKLRERMRDLFNARIELMIDKSHDYSDDEDTLANFKRMQQICKILHIAPQRSPGDCARFLMMLKVDRWCNLVNSGKPPANESVRDTVIDLHNYIDLADASDCEQASADLTN